MSDNEQVQELKVDYWQFDYALAQLRRWGATAVALHRNEVGGYSKVQKEGKVWKHYSNQNVSEEQYRSIRALTAYVLAYSTANTSGTLLLLIIPNVQGLLETRNLTAKVREELAGVVHDKRQRGES